MGAPQGPLPATEYDCAIVRSVKATSQALVHFETNRYSVPHSKSGGTLTLKASSQTLCLYDGADIAATHPRSYEKYRVLENPAHYAGLLAKRKKARAAKRVEAFLALGPECEAYLKGLVASELHLASHLDKILELVRDHGKAEVLEAIRRAHNYGAFGAAYVHNIVLQRESARNRPLVRPIVLTKRPDWSEVEVEETDLAQYDELFGAKPSKGADPQQEIP